MSKFVSELKKLWVDDFGYTANEQLLENWKLLGETFYDSFNRNSDGRRSQIISAFSMGAGEGKSVGTALYCAKFIVPHKERRAIIIVSRTALGVEMVDNINRWSNGKSAKILSSDKRVKDALDKDDAEAVKEAQVLVITHERLRNALHKRHKAIPISELLEGRQLVVIDEAIDFSATHTIRASVMSHLSLIVEYDLSSRVLKKHRDTFEEEKNSLLTFLNTFKHITEFGDRNSAVVDYEHKETRTFPYIKHLLIKHSRHLTKIKLDGDKTAADLITDIEKLINFERFFLKVGADAYISTSTDYMPTKTSAVILDASSKINETYAQYERQGKAKVILTKRARNFKNLTIHIARANTGKSGMLLKNNEPKPSILYAIENEVEDKTSISDSVALCTHKAVREKLDDNYLHDRNPILFHFGATTGSNEARACNKMLVFGLPHKPQVDEKNKMHRNGNDLNDAELEAKYRNSQVLDELFQLMFRSAIRVPSDKDGGCIPTDIYITLPSANKGNGAELYAYVKSKLPDLFPDATISKWESSSSARETVTSFEKDDWSLNQPEQEREPVVSQIIDILSKLSELKYTSPDIYKVGGMNKDNFNRAMRSDRNVNYVHEATGYLFGKYPFAKSRGGKFVDKKGFKKVDFE